MSRLKVYSRPENLARIGKLASWAGMISYVVVGVYSVLLRDWLPQVLIPGMLYFAFASLFAIVIGEGIFAYFVSKFGRREALFTPLLRVGWASVTLAFLFLLPFIGPVVALPLAIASGGGVAWDQARNKFFERIAAFLIRKSV